MTELSIGEVSKITDLPTKTIRFYEEEGLITKPSRKENGYRQYSLQNVDELKVIKQARSLGLSITQIKNLLHNSDHLANYLKSLIQENNQKITTLQATQKKLNALQKELQHSQTTCTNDDYCCNIFYQTLKQKTKGGEIN